MSLHDAPGTADLVEAVREFLERDVLAVTTGRVNFHTRVAINVLAIVGRELADGAKMEERHGAGLAALGFASDADLARAIRRGDVDERIGVVAAFVRDSVRDKLAVAHPGYVG